MDFKSFFKNKNTIILMVLIALIIISAALIRVTNVFVYVLAVLFAILCLFFAYLSYVSYLKQVKNINFLLSTKGEKEIIKLNKELKRIKFGCIVKIVSFVIAAIMFILFMFNIY